MSDGFVRVAASDELREGGGIQRTVGDREVGQNELVFHRPDIAERIDAPGRVRHAVIGEHSKQVQQRVRVAEP